MFDFGNPLPAGLTVITLGPGAAMESQHLRPRILQSLGKFDNINFPIIPTEAGFNGNRYIYRRHDSFNNGFGHFRLPQQRRTTTFFGDFIDRTAHINVYRLGSVGHRFLGRFRHKVRPTVKQLDTDGIFLGINFHHLGQSAEMVNFRGADHFCVQHGLGSIAPHQTPKNQIRHPR